MWSNDKGERRKGTLDAAGFGSAGILIRSAIEDNKGGLHGADLLSPTMDRHKHCRSGLDLIDMANKRKRIQDPKALDLRGGECCGNRDALSFHNPSYCVYNNKHRGIAVMRSALALNTDLPAGTKPNRIQIFVRTPTGNTTLIWTHDTNRVIDLKNNVANQIGYPTCEQKLVIGGRSLQDHITLKEYNIKPGSSIMLNLRLRGGAATSKATEGGSGSKSNYDSAQHQ